MRDGAKLSAMPVFAEVALLTLAWLKVVPTVKHVLRELYAIIRFAALRVLAVMETALFLVANAWLAAK
jgi:hypothetical protein